MAKTSYKRTLGPTLFTPVAGGAGITIDTVNSRAKWWIEDKFVNLEYDIFFSAIPSSPVTWSVSVPSALVGIDTSYHKAYYSTGYFDVGSVNFYTTGGSEQVHVGSVTLITSFTSGVLQFNGDDGNSNWTLGTSSGFPATATSGTSGTFVKIRARWKISI